MEASEDLCLLFASGEYYFLAPVFCVQRVGDGTDEENDIDTIYLSGKPPEQEASGYRIYLESGGRCAALWADRALGIRDINEEPIFSLEAPVIHDGNRYIQSAVPMQDEEKQIMAYVLNPGYLLENKDLWTI